MEKILGNRVMMSLVRAFATAASISLSAATPVNATPEDTPPTFDTVIFDHRDGRTIEVTPETRGIGIFNYDADDPLYENGDAGTIQNGFINLFRQELHDLGYEPTEEELYQTVQFLGIVDAGDGFSDMAQHGETPTHSMLVVTNVVSEGVVPLDLSEEAMQVRIDYLKNNVLMYPYGMFSNPDFTQQMLGAEEENPQTSVEGTNTIRQP